MKASKTLLFAALAATALAGCTNDEGAASVPDLAGTPIRIHTNLLERNLTRAGYQAGELKEGSFGLFLTTAGAEGDSRYNATNMQFKHDGTAWTAAEGEEQLLWKNDSAKVSYYAYMPYNADATADPANYTVTVPEDQTAEDESGIKEADFLYYKHEGTVTATSGTEVGAIDIEFQHQLSYLTVKLKRLDTAKGVTFTSVTLQNCATSATFDLTEGTLTPATERDGSISLLPAGAEDNADGSKTDIYECILIPQSFQSITILITGVDGAGNTKVYKYVSSTEQLESNTKYTLALNVGNDYVTAGTVSVSEWGTEGGWTMEGEAEAIGFIAMSEDETLTSEMIAEALERSGSNKLAISGPMNSDDLTTIADYLKKNSGTTIDLDLSDAGLTSIPNLTFGAYFDDEAAQSLGQVNLPTTLTGIGGNAFRYCPSFTITNWGELTSLTRIGNAAFMGSGLSGDITLPESITTIEGMAFYQTNITSIVIPSDITTIGIQMFFRCYSLKKVVFNGDVKSLDTAVFGACSALEEIDFSACTTVPTYPEYGNPFADIAPANINKIKLIVDKDLVSDFAANPVWKQCNVVAVNEDGDNPIG